MKLKDEIGKIKEKIKKIRSKKPEFLRYDWDKYYRLERQETWRKPKGRDNPMRLELKGYPPKVKVGYRTPKDIRGLHPSGLIPVYVRNEKELMKVANSNEKEKIIIIFSSTLGLKKKLELVEKAKQLGLKVANG